jgi:uncharacterized membrane protein
MQPKPKASSNNVDRRLHTRLRLYAVIFLIMLVIVIVDIVRGFVSVPLALLGLAIGTILGLVLGRMYRLSWDGAGSKVIAQIDWLGGVILGLYIVFAIFRNQLFGHWVTGAVLGAFTLSLTAGTMLGRVVSTAHGIRRLLAAWGYER